MLVIGLSGGVASGKSLVASCFEHFGATVINADRIGHEVLKISQVIAEIESQWGQDVIRDGEVDRSALAQIVFDTTPKSANQLERLEQITHPRIGQLIRKRLAQLRTEAIAAVLDAPVMFKSGWDGMCDKIVFIQSDRAIRLQRARQRGWDSDELDQRELRQTPINEKRSRSTDIINNSQSKLDTYIQARDLWRSWNLPLPDHLDSPLTLFPTTQHTKSQN